jgi:hypothetical protein
LSASIQVDDGQASVTQPEMPVGLQKNATAIRAPVAQQAQ